MSKTSFQMESNGSILNSRDYVLSVTLTHQYDPTAIEAGRPFAKSALRKVKTNIESFTNYVNTVPTGKTRGRWDKFVMNGEIDTIKRMLTK
jgi:hypothetical protein